MQTVADDGGDIRLDVAERIDADAREDAEALTLQVLEALAGLVPVVAVGTPAVRVEEHVGGSDQTADLDEVFRLSDRIITMYEGRITGEFRTSDITKEEIGWYMTGHREGKEAAKA